MVVVINGPIASGKSTLGRNVARVLETRGVPTALIDVDDLYATQRDVTDGDGRWEAARRAGGTLARSLHEGGRQVVIVEDDLGTVGEREILLAALGTPPFVVTLRASYGAALRRAQADSTRGVSRDPSFLGPYYARRTAPFVGPDDLVIDTETLGVEQATARIVDSIRSRVAPGRG